MQRVAAATALASKVPTDNCPRFVLRNSLRFVLLSSGPLINASDANGRTPLLLALDAKVLVPNTLSSEPGVIL